MIFAFVAAGLATSAHSSFLFFYPVLLSPVVQRGWRSNPWRRPEQALLLGTSLAFGLFPYLMILDLAIAAPGAGVGLQGPSMPNWSEMWSKTNYLLCFGSSFTPHRLRMATDGWD